MNESFSKQSLKKQLLQLFNSFLLLTKLSKIFY